MSRHSLLKLAEYVGIKILIDVPVRKVEFDSRKIGPNDLFVALKGQKVDGHDYLQAAAVQGAVAALVSDQYEGKSFGMELLAVPDPLRALQQMAGAVFAKRSCKVVAVTGSVGKTTTKELIAQLLSLEFKTAKTLGNVNSQAGLPLFLLNELEDEEVCVVEMGMSAPGEISRLVEMVPPDMAVVTKIALAHAAYFPTGLHGIAGAKAEIFSHPQTQIGFVNAQAASFSEVMEVGGCRKKVYGLEQDEGKKDLILRRGEGGVQILEKGEASPWFTLPFTASHLTEDFLAAAAVARAFGISWEKIVMGASELTLCPKRFEQVEREGVLFINDSYNANPTSVKAALNNLPAATGKRIAVLGEMLEMGEFAELGHREVAECAVERVDHVLCIGDHVRFIVERFHAADKPAEHFPCLDSLKARLDALAHPGDVVLIKGSQRLQLWKILD